MKIRIYKNKYKEWTGEKVWVYNLLSGSILIRLWNIKIKIVLK